MDKICFGIDVGGTTVKMGIFTTEGKLTESWEIPTRKEDEGSHILEDICKQIEEKLVEKQINRADLLGVGIGIPGPITKDGTVLNCVNLGWGVFNVEEKLSEMLGGVTVKAGNDANVAALGENWQGGGVGFEDLILITLGTGVGGGVIIGDKIITGSNGAAGEIGHMPVVYDTDAETCGCGKKGCLETVASATGIVREAKKLLASGEIESTLRDIPEFTCKDIFDAAKEGDKAAMIVVDKLAEYLGIAAAHIACVTNPQIIVIGGGVSKAGKFLLDKIEEKYMERAFKACRNAKFALATLGNDAGMYGAAALILCK
ncbi:ROK family glucokinase [Lachnospiraceae bacterium HCP1S3_C3]|nr:ROK family glucokinase [Lachnospiraceae bacterium]MDD6858769.1 ROK family glucokinase [Lachnospiraceae bacterium]